MKIGVITFHRAPNCGAALQTYGLFEFLRLKGHDVEIIDYIPNNLAYVKRGKIRGILHVIKQIVTPVESKRFKEKEKAFIKFRENNLKLSKVKYLGDNEIEKGVFNYDLVISGSDQILNTTLTGDSKAYYLHFTNSKKVSYASSFGRTDISNTEREFIKDYLVKFDQISVREKSAGKIVNELIKVDSSLVCDPVFLMSPQEWMSKIEQSVNLHDYIFVYLMEENENTDAIINAIETKYHMPFITVIGGKVSKKYSNRDFACGPDKFINYIYNAKYVITNSFHASAFSIIFGKQFWTVAHSCRNTRLENLFEIIDAENKLVNNLIKVEELEKYVVNGQMAYNNMQGLIENSREYLIRLLKAD